MQSGSGNTRRFVEQHPCVWDHVRSNPSRTRMVPFLHVCRYVETRDTWWGIRRLLYTMVGIDDVWRRTWSRDCASWDKLQLPELDKVISMHVHISGGGVGNVLFAIRYIFMYGLALNRRVELSFDPRVDIHSIITPGQYDWRPQAAGAMPPPKHYLMYCSNRTDSSAFKIMEPNIRIRTVDGSNGWRCNFGSVFRKLRNAGLLPQKQYTRISNIAHSSSCFFQYFFRFNQTFYQHLPPGYLEAPHKLGLHLRWGDAQYIGRQPSYQQFKREIRISKELMGQCAIFQPHCINKVSAGKYLFVATDNPAGTKNVLKHILKTVESNANNFSVDEGHWHTGKLNNNVTVIQSAYKHAFRDFLGLMLAEKVFSPTHSTFSLLAAEAGLKRTQRSCPAFCKALIWAECANEP